MNTLLYRWFAVAVLVVPAVAYAQNSAGIAGPSAPFVPPNTPGTVTYQSSGGTETAPGGTTVFHGTGATTTITFAGSEPPPQPQPSPEAPPFPTVIPFR